MHQAHPERGPALVGTTVAILSALAFGLSTPLVQRFGRARGPFAIAALLYTGACIVGLVSRSRSEARVRASNAGRVALVGALGAGIAPALLAWGLLHTSGVSASLMLNLEAVFTVALARILYAEHVGRRLAFAVTLLAAGGALLVVQGGGDQGAASTMGLLAVAAASLAWALDNALAKPLSAIDPASVVAAKSAVGVALSASLAWILGEAWPSPKDAAVLVAVGATGYGLSLRLYLRAQRALGAGRTASVFASAPFFGAALAWLLGEPATWSAWLGGALMIVGLVLHLTERHAHVHTHEPVEHEHAHRHDDGHHTHRHDPMPEGEHNHVHRHDLVVHEHPHMPDLHHGHAHES
ncbi:Permease of the drug/metabolite transporter (DMT) superfamily [Labilithrix luteola]|uniref:Permease of the drug/metabolite transporter (DMT) superfamily n=1 Tax=Labilithrix luteola TaxID=1391654 RepID=A0A0K1Q540_9BACT|nr:Permease of the drug/metabolite transporter (DMT) superfamily [Labilithrix luteola]